MDAVATSAIRDAANRDELLRAIEDRTGLEVRVISGAEEAWYGYLAIANSTTVTDGFGIDVGGGSVQIMRIDDRRLGEAESVRLGAVRVSEAFLPDEEASSKQMKALRKHVVPHARRVRVVGRREPGAGLPGVGGTIRNLAAAAQKRLGPAGRRRAGLPADARRARGADRVAGGPAGVASAARCAESSPTAAT